LLAEGTNDWKAAYQNNKLSVLYKDSLINEETTKKTLQTQMNFEFDKKEQAVKLEQEKKDLIVNKEKQTQTIIIISISAGLILVFVLALVILRSLRQNQKQNKIIIDQKVLVEKQKELVDQKQKEILDSIQYGKRIQTALMASEKYFDKSLNKLIK
jgi:hypothetical protein